MKKMFRLKLENFILVIKYETFFNSIQRVLRLRNLYDIQCMNAKQKKIIFFLKTQKNVILIEIFFLSDDEL